MSLVLNALHGDDPLGFLAAVGVLALSEQGAIAPTRLGWQGEGTPVAVVDGHDSVEELADELHSLAERLHADGAVIHGVDTSFPLQPTGTKDPMRMEREALRSLYEAADRSLLAERNPWPGRWLVALAAHSSLQDEKRGDVELTPFYAPTGRMTMRVSLFERPLEATLALDGPGDAFTYWRRNDFDGANYDERALRDAGVTTDGDAANRGAASPTWLAVMGMRYFPLSDNGRAVQAVGWERKKLLPGYTSRSLVWPIWDQPLNPPAVRALLGHPALRLVELDTGPSPRDPAALRGLGVTAVYGASRRTRSQGDGPLGPGVTIWRGG